MSAPARVKRKVGMANVFYQGHLGLEERNMEWPKHLVVMVKLSCVVFLSSAPESKP